MYLHGNLLGLGAKNIYSGNTVQVGIILKNFEQALKQQLWMYLFSQLQFTSTRVSNNQAVDICTVVDLCIHVYLDIIYTIHKP